MQQSNQQGNQDAVVSALLSIAEAVLDRNQQSLYSVTGNMNSLSVTTAYQNAASITLPVVSAAHKYLIIANFQYTHAGGAATRDYTCAIRNGTSALKTISDTAIAGDFVHELSASHILTSSSTGGETINLSILRSTDNGGTLSSASHYSIIDLGVA